MEMEVHLNKLMSTYDEIWSEDIQCFIERVKNGFIMNLLELKVGFLGTG